VHIGLFVEEMRQGATQPAACRDIFELADRIQIQRLARRSAVIKPETHSMEDAVAIMTGARAA